MLRTGPAKAGHDVLVRRSTNGIIVVVGHVSDVVEHPQLVAQSTPETDCGLGSRVSHPEIAWAKLQALVEGAAVASRSLWSG